MLVRNLAAADYRDTKHWGGGLKSEVGDRNPEVRGRRSVTDSGRVNSKSDVGFTEANEGNEERWTQDHLPRNLPCRDGLGAKLFPFVLFVTFCNFDFRSNICLVRPDFRYLTTDLRPLISVPDFWPMPSASRLLIPDFRPGELADKGGDGLIHGDPGFPAQTLLEFLVGVTVSLPLGRAATPVEDGWNLSP